MDTASLTDSLKDSVTKPITKSPEVITPSAFDHERRQQSGRVAVFNLVSTMVGGGVLSLPFAVSRCGLGLGLILLYLSALASDFSFDILVSSARRTGAMTYAQIAYFAFGKKTTFIIPLLVFVLCWMASIAYLVIMGDLYTPVICFFGGIKDDQCGPMWRYIAICGGCALVAPVCYFRNLQALKYTSFISLGSVFVLAGVILYSTVSDSAWTSEHSIYYVDNHGNSLSYRLNPKLKLWPDTWQDIIYVFPIFGVSFLCHFNIPQIHSELTRPSRKRVRRVLHATVFLCSVLYSIVGTFGYLWSFEYTCGNILLNYKKQDVLVTIGRIGLGLTVMLSFPLLILPARSSFHDLLNQCECIRFRGMNLGDNLNNSSFNVLDTETQKRKQKSSKDIINDATNKQKQRRNYFNDTNANVPTDTEEEQQQEHHTPQQSLQPIPTQSQTSKNHTNNGKNTNNTKYTRSASPQLLGSSHHNNGINIDPMSDINPVYHTDEQIDSYNYNNNNDNIHDNMNDLTKTQSMQSAQSIQSIPSMAAIQGSINSPENRLKNSRQHSRNIQVIDRRANAYESQKSQNSGTGPPKRATKSGKSFLTRSFSGLDSPLRSAEDAIAVVHSASDLEKFDHLKSLWDKLDSAATYDPSRMMLIIETTLLVGSVLFVATEVESVLTLWTVMGSTVSFLIGFTFPGAFFWTIRKKKSGRLRNQISLFISILSALLLAICTWQAVIHVSDPACPNQPS